MISDPLVLVGVGVAVVIGGVIVFRLHAFLALLAGAIIVAALTPSEAIETFAHANLEPGAAADFITRSFGWRIAQGFGKTCAGIGIAIALASIIGRGLLESGAADRIVRSSTGWLGEKRAPIAFTASGFALAVPVFFDTVFYLMVPLAKALALRTRGSVLLLVLSITAGATMAHSLVPPTPGPLFVASEFGVEISTMIIAGAIVGLIASTAGFLFAIWADRRWPLPLRSGKDFSDEELRGLAARPTSELPGVVASLLPIVIPVTLIAVPALLPKPIDETESGWILETLQSLGEKNVALAIGAALALLLLLRNGENAKGHGVKHSVGAALEGAGVIILITAMGGAFGQVLKQSGVGDRIRELSELYHIGILPLAFGVTALVRAAQGSATVAMFTATGLVAGAIDFATLGFHPVYVALAIGCGSKPFQWMNDSGFWVICRMSGMTEREGLRTLTPMLTIMGFVGFAAVALGAWLFPMAG